MTTLAAAEPQLEFFDEEGQHEYRLDGVKIPSVTTILNFGKSLDHIPAWTSQRGTALHLATEYDDAGDLDESTVDPLVMPHLVAYRKWKERCSPNIVATELRVWGEIDGLVYCGTLDRIALLPEGPTLIDIKSGAPRKEHGAQLHAYAVAYRQRHRNYDVSHLAGLYLGKDAAWALRRYDEPAHLDYFKQKLAAYYAATGD